MSPILVGLAGFAVVVWLGWRTGPDHPTRGPRSGPSRHRDRI